MIFARRCIGAIEHGISTYILVFGSERAENKISLGLDSSKHGLNYFVNLTLCSYKKESMF